MKTHIVINIETSNVAPIYDEFGTTLDDNVMKQLEKDLHTAIENWIKESVATEAIMPLITENYYELESLKGVDSIEDVVDLKISYNDENIVDILRFVSAEEQLTEKVNDSEIIDLEDKVVVPPMEIDTEPEEEFFEEEDEKEDNDEEIKDDI